MAYSELISEPLMEEGAFNWIYLVDWIVIGVLTLFFLFYFNRLFATVVTYFLRLYTWRYYRIYIDIDALQFSPLAGRIFFKGVKYHGQNETIFVHSGNITWRYWLPRVKKALLFHDGGATASDASDGNTSSGDSAANGEAQKDEGFAQISDKLPCRTVIKVSGVEAFIYNRSPAYDWIVSNITQQDQTDPPGDTQSKVPETSDNANYRDGINEKSDPLSPGSLEDVANNSIPAAKADPLGRWQTNSSAPSYADRSVKDKRETPSRALTPPSILRLLPIRVECNRAAAVLGNDNTKAILSAKVDSAFGEFDASESGPLDIFKILMSFEVSHPYIQMKPNVDFKELQLAEATGLESQHDAEVSESGNKGDGKGLAKSGSHTMWKRIAKVARNASKSTESIVLKSGLYAAYERLPLHGAPPPGGEQWKGLARYIDDAQRDEHDEWLDVEYAKSSMIADIPKVAFQFYWDIPGPVSPRPLSDRPEDQSKLDPINGSTPPDYGMKLAVHGGQVVYGPWADRHRIILQQIFFPTPFTDAIPGSQLLPGQTRVATVFRLDLCIKEDTTLRIPFREPSKDSKWIGRAAALTRQPNPGGNQNKKHKSRKGSASNRNKTRGIPATDVRPFAWFDVVVKAPTTIHFEQDLTPRHSGYENDLNVDVEGVEIYSSLNHALLWRSNRVTVNGDLGYPLPWNGLRIWTFTLGIERLDLFLLRDHTFLLVDLIEDWSTGPLAEFHTFVPYRYILKVHFQDFKLYLNTNDANIINDSTDLDDNDFIVLYGKTLDSELTIPIDHFRPLDSIISFDVNSKDLGFEVLMPSKNTLKELLTEKDVAHLSSVDIMGSYTMCSETKPGLTETLFMDINGAGLVIQFYGFLGRHLAKIKENYFGETVHFRTLEEYQELIRRNFDAPDMEQPVIKGNDLDVILDITAVDVNILLPAELYNADEHIKLHVDSADVDLRVNNYYLELMVNSVPLELTYNEIAFAGPTPEDSKYQQSSTQMFIDGVRVFGHRLFGLPPSEPAYVSNWDVEAGDILGECSPSFFRIAKGVAQSLIMGLSDSENAVPVPLLQKIHDSTFVRFACPKIRLSCLLENTAIQLSVQQVEGNFNDLADELFSQRLNMIIPHVVVACVDIGSLRKFVEDKNVKTLAHVETSVSMKMVKRELQFDMERKAQHDFIREQDIQRGTRAAFMAEASSPTVVDNFSDEISLPLPNLPDRLQPLLNAEDATKTVVLPDTGRKPSHHSSPAKAEDAFGLPSTPLPSDSLLLPLPNEYDERARSSSPSHHRNTIPLSSTFKIPAFPSTSLEPDLSDVPRVHPPMSQRNEPLDNGTGQQLFDLADEDTVHASFMIKLEPGLTAYCQPDAIRAVAELMSRLEPRHPVQVIDNLQFLTVSEILASNARKEGNNSITDITFAVPQVRVRIVHDLKESANAREQRSDHYELDANDISVAARIKVVPTRPNEPDANYVRAAVGSLKAHAQEGEKGSTQEAAAVEARVDDVLLWLSDSDSTSVHASFKGAELAMASKQIDYFAHLIYRTTQLVADIQSRFLKIFVDEELRRRYVVYMLTNLGENMPDPAFLTRPSYVIRSSAEHVRNSDSWKIISRFQYVYRKLAVDDRAELIDNCTSLQFLMPPESEAEVLAKLDSWRSWDALRIKESFIIRIVYKSEGDVQKLHDRSSIPVNVGIQCLALRIVIDPGSKQSAFSLEHFTTALSIDPPPLRSAIELFHDYSNSQSKSHALQIKTSKINLNADWDICQLVDRVLALFEQQALTGSESIRDVVTTKPEPAPPQTFHIVFSTDLAAIQVSTPNSNQELSVAALKVSVTGSDWDPATDVLHINAALAAEALLWSFSSPENRLLRLKVASPTLWIAYAQTEGRKLSSPSLKLAADSKDISLQTQDDVLALIHTVQAIVSDEVLYVQHLIEAHEQNDLHSPAESSSTPTQPLLINLALFLNTYSVDIVLFSGVVYSTTGNVIRLSVSPHETPHIRYQADFDLKAQTHTLSTLSSAGKSLAEFQIPSLNGSFGVHLLDSTLDASAMISMEKIDIEGSAVYGMMNVFMSKSAAITFNRIQTDAVAVIEQIQNIMPQKTLPSPKESSAKPFVFGLRAVLAGIAISADAPGLSPQSASSNLLFEISPIIIRTSNRSPAKQKPLPFPEFRVTLGEVAVELRQSEGPDQLRLAGKLGMKAVLTCKVETPSPYAIRRAFELSITGPAVEIGAAAAPTIVYILSHLQKRMKGIDFPDEHHYLKRLKNLDKKFPERRPKPSIDLQTDGDEESLSSGVISTFAFELRSMRLSYVTEDPGFKPSAPKSHDLVLTLQTLQLLTRSQAEARLNIKNLQLALVNSDQASEDRPTNSALLPEVIFRVGHKTTKTERRLVLQAAGKALDFQLDPNVVLPVNDLERSITASSKRLRAALKELDVAPDPAAGGLDTKKLLGDRRLSSLIVDADFAGSVVRLQAPSNSDGQRTMSGRLRAPRGRYGQFAGEENAASATFIAPGIAVKVQYMDPGNLDPSLNVEIRISGSKNELRPSVVPLFLQISEGVKQVVREDAEDTEAVEAGDKQEEPIQPFNAEETIVKADPKAILGRTKLSLGIRVCRQEFSLSCQPFAKVAATASLEDIYITVKNIEPDDKEQFFAVTAAVKGLSASLQHVYSRTITASFHIDSIILSLMNSKHLSGKSGISAILKVNPTKMQLNAKQLQDMLLFREIWLPLEIRQSSAQTAAASESNEPGEYFMYRYQQVAASTAFTWNATVTFAKLIFDLDLGQSIGKTSSSITNLWMTSTKSSSSRQNLCIGIDDVNVSSAGRLSGYVALEKVKIRTSIAWPHNEANNKAPLIQGSVGFDQLRVKAAFDYQAFAVADVTSFEFIMYNIRERSKAGGDRLVAILDGDKVNVYCIAATATYGLALFQAFERLVQEKETSYDQALQDIEKFLRRRSTVVPQKPTLKATTTLSSSNATKETHALSLHTDVVFTVRSLDVGAFPTTLQDQQILKGEASDIQARFAVVYEDGKIHSGLGMTLGQLRVALAAVQHMGMPKTLGEISVEEVTANARAARGGIILRVPRVVAAMQTWQTRGTNNIDYIFRSSFEGKIDVGWNFSRISFIRGMYTTHTRTLASRLGKPLPEPAVKIKGAPLAPSDSADVAATPPPTSEQKITAEVTLPQSSKYTYRALEPPIIETPQLRDMGEATPPLEWVGLHRDRLPNVTHQILIVTLLEIANEVEDAYRRILGSA